MAGKNVVRVLSETSKRDEKGVMCTLSEQKIPYDRVPVRVTLKLEMEKFDSLMDPNEPTVKEFWSRGVSSELAPRAVWKLQVWPRLDDSSSAVDLHLTGPMADSKESLATSFHTYLIGVDGAEDGIDSIERGTYEFGNDGCYHKRFEISHERVEKALQVDGSLVMAAEVDFITPYAVGKSDLCSLWRGTIGKLLGSGDYSDCTLMVGGEVLKAHRLLLSAISPIFGKMFGNSSFEEAKDGVVRIDDPPGMLKDSSAKPYRALLAYAYTGCIDWAHYDDCKRDVLVLACKYLIRDLKHHVEGRLAREITAVSFAELALLADTYSCKRLKKACVHYLSVHYPTLVLSAQWEAMNKARLELANELLRLVRHGKITADEATTTGVANLTLG